MGTLLPGSASASHEGVAYGASPPAGQSRVHEAHRGLLWGCGQRTCLEVSGTQVKGCRDEKKHENLPHKNSFAKF